MFSLYQYATPLGYGQLPKMEELAFPSFWRGGVFRICEWFWKTHLFFISERYSHFYKRLSAGIIDIGRKDKNALLEFNVNYFAFFRFSKPSPHIKRSEILGHIHRTENIVGRSSRTFYIAKTLISYVRISSKTFTTYVWNIITRVKSVFAGMTCYRFPSTIRERPESATSKRSITPNNRIIPIRAWTWPLS